MLIGGKGNGTDRECLWIFECGPLDEGLSTVEIESQKSHLDRGMLYLPRILVLADYAFTPCFPFKKIKY
jgi:hypothetical protein